MTRSKIARLSSLASPMRNARVQPARDHRPFEDRTTCPSCGRRLVIGDGWMRCEIPSHYTRVTMSADALGEELRDGDGIAWGQLGADRHARANPTYVYRIDPK